jgi:hypothetical protein
MKCKRNYQTSDKISPTHALNCNIVNSTQHETRNNLLDLFRCTPNASWDSITRFTKHMFLNM